MPKNKTVKEFSRQFDGLELLTHSNASTTLGDLYEKKKVGKNRLDFAGNIAFKLGLPVDKAEEILQKLKDAPLHAGAFAGMSIKDNFAADASLSIPSVNVNLEGKVERSKVLGFEIGDIKTKILRDTLRYEIETAIEKLKDEDKKEFRQELKRLHIAEQLFYSDSVSITIKKDVTVDVDATFKESIGQVSVGVDKDHNQVFTISGAHFPFALDLKKVKDFI